MAKTKSTTKAKTGKQKLAAAAPSAPNIDIGITQGDRKKIADGLSRFQADAFTLYLKTHNFHWNVTGSMFNSLHTMFETQYTEQWAALDDVAERIRALGFNAPGSYNEAVCRTAREVLEVAAKGDDAPTEDLMTQRLQTHEKYAWMLRSLLQ
ncbi:MAG: DNA starvation/stationary phase protection protein [Stenotrophomonas maltophilia]|nr:MAG: DNA starvation/stationary phase protection protein [Stenotrophomonas maltophilia]